MRISTWQPSELQHRVEGHVGTIALEAKTRLLHTWTPMFFRNVGVHYQTARYHYPKALYMNFQGCENLRRYTEWKKSHYSNRNTCLKVYQKLVESAPLHTFTFEKQSSVLINTEYMIFNRQTASSQKTENY